MASKSADDKAPKTASGAARSSGDAETRSSESDLENRNPAGQDQSFQQGSRESRIRESAYRKYEARGGAAGHEVQDWLDSEREIDQEGDAGGSSAPRT